MKRALFAALICAAGATSLAQQPAQLPTPRAQTPLFFREPWRQTGPFEAPEFRPQHPVTQAAVTNPRLVLTVHDPGAADITAYARTPPARSLPRDWRGPSCVLMSGYSQDPPPANVPAGEPSDPPNLWTGVCMTPVAVTLRDTASYVDLTGMARIRWVTRVSGFHEVRPVIRLADGTWLVGDYGEGAHASNSTAFLETEFPVAPIRWLTLDISRVVTTGTWVDEPDLSRVDEVGFADLLPGSGHGWGGFVNVGRIEVYGRPVPR
jgi:hypothetical protein